MAEELYTWVPFYTELANKLLPYKNDRAALIDKLQAMYESIDTKLPKLDDGGVPNDIDPLRYSDSSTKVSQVRTDERSLPLSQTYSASPLNYQTISLEPPCSTT